MAERATPLGRPSGVPGLVQKQQSHRPASSGCQDRYALRHLLCEVLQQELDLKLPA